MQSRRGGPGPVRYTRTVPRLRATRPPLPAAAWTVSVCALAVLFVSGGPAHAQPPQGNGVFGAPEGATAPAAPRAADVEPDTRAARPDVIHLTNGGRVEGFVLEESDEGVVLTKELGRGKFSDVTLRPEQVARVEYAPPAARAAMRTRVEWWKGKKSRDARAMSRYDIQKTPGMPGVRHAAGRYVTVHSDLNPGFIRELAFRLNSMWDLWLALFERDTRGGPPSRMFVLHHEETYRGLLAQTGLPRSVVVLSAGLYAPEHDIGLAHTQSAMSHQYQRYIAEMERKYGNRLDPVALDWAKRRLRSHVRSEQAWAISTLYHETMHAFMNKELFPGKADLVPVWLNEGMASYVMSLREDVSGLHTDEMQPEMYPLVRMMAAQDSLPPIEQLVARRESITVHETRESAAAFYAAAWGLVYYLNNERDALTNGMYASYMRELEKGTEPKRAFEIMTGEPLADTEAAWQAAILDWH